MRVWLGGCLRGCSRIRSTYDAGQPPLDSQRREEPKNDVCVLNARAFSYKEFGNETEPL
jgi:hypothetical protein